MTVELEAPKHCEETFLVLSMIPEKAEGMRLVGRPVPSYTIVPCKLDGIDGYFMPVRRVSR